MQQKKVKPREATKTTILVKPLICIALILTNKAKINLFQICERKQSKFGKHNKTDKYKAKTLKPADMESATTK